MRGERLTERTPHRKLISLLRLRAQQNNALCARLSYQGNAPIVSCYIKVHYLVVDPNTAFELISAPRRRKEYTNGYE